MTTTRQTIQPTAPTRSVAAGDVAARAAAALAVTCVLLHVVLIADGGRAALGMTLPMLIISAVCASCAPKAWRRRSAATSALLTMLGTGAVMVLVHLVLSGDHMAMSQHAHGTDMTAMHHAHAGGVIAELLPHLALSLAVTQAALAGAAVWLRRRVEAAT